MAGDAIAAEDFALIAGPAADGTLMSYGPGPPATPESELLAEQFAAKGYAGSFGLAPFHAYAIVQAWAKAVEHAGTFGTGAVAEALHSLQFETVLGRIGFDEKGDVTGVDPFVWYVWQGDTYVPWDPAERSE